MKKIIKSSLIFLTTLTFLGNVFVYNVMAVTSVVSPPEPFKIEEPPEALSNIPKVVGAGFRIILIVAALIAFLYLLMGGLKWITSGGDKAGVEAARDQIIHALIGIVVVLAAWGLIVLIEQMTGTGLGFSQEINLPTLK